MVHWAWLILAFVAGQVSLFVTLAIFRGAADKAEDQPEEAEEKPVYIMADEIKNACMQTTCDRCPLDDKVLCYSDGADIPENYRLMKEAGLIK